MSSKNKPSSSSSSSRTPTKRILTELAAFNTSPPPTIPSLTSSPTSLLSLRAILVSPPSQNLPAYTHGRWLLSIAIPPTYPIAPPVITFVTKICHPNIKFETGEICLDVLGERWTPVLGVVGALEAVGRLLGEPGVDSPLNVDVAALVRGGDWVGSRGLAGFWTGEERFEGGIEE
ncbi:ubiquitin-conjugating enzyme/RWD-like protein [Calycina marina]|uniref:Ubiquitin-conjugating enzyme/RWD-like protein n=1 Tax=Calycina marina TaxID=1763456 RepID=A0A9P8CH99_9HELO|nr:ubiquitin-conjugating enzyme/RWD-like protein [Calycina marina]